MALLIAAPVHHQVEPAFAMSLLHLDRALTKLGYVHEVTMPAGESLVQRVRNKVARDFLDGGWTHLLFLDADLAFEPEDVLLLLRSGLPLVGGAYPFKDIAWKKIHAAALRGVPPEELHAHAARFVFAHEGKGTEVQVKDGCVPVKYLATGFLLIERSVFTRIAAMEPDNWYRSGLACEKGKSTHSFFDCPVVDGNLLSEDWSFSRKAKLAGIQPMLHLSCTLAHIGPHAYRGDMRTMFTERVA